MPIYGTKPSWQYLSNTAGWTMMAKGTTLRDVEAVCYGRIPATSDLITAIGLWLNRCSAKDPTLRIREYLDRQAAYR